MYTLSKSIRFRRELYDLLTNMSIMSFPHFRWSHVLLLSNVFNSIKENGLGSINKYTYTHTNNHR